MRLLQRFTLFLLFICLASGLSSQPLSDQARVSILSFGPGPEVYAIWGHTAIRITDPAIRIDKVYNYGTFDFDTPNFLMQFLRGKLDYTLSIQAYPRVVRTYKKENRWIREQMLDMTRQEMDRLYFLLEENFLPENRYYKYDFFYDNCASRPREIIEKSMEHQIVFPVDEEKTFRNILDEHLIHVPWLDFGIDLLIGARADQEASARQQMFMPIYFYNNFTEAHFKTKDQKLLVKQEISIFESKSFEWPQLPFILRPIFVISLLLLLEILLFVYRIKRKKVLFQWYDKLWFYLVSIGSLVMLIMWFGTDHLATKENWNLLWMNPLFLLLLLPLKQSYKRMVSRILFIVLIGTLMAWFLIPQQFHIAFLPIIIILGIKAFSYGFLDYTKG